MCFHPVDIISFFFGHQSCCCTYVYQQSLSAVTFFLGSEPDNDLEREQQPAARQGDRRRENKGSFLSPPAPLRTTSAARSTTRASS